MRVDPEQKSIDFLSVSVTVYNCAWFCYISEKDNIKEIKKEKKMTRKINCLIQLRADDSVTSLA